MDPLLSDILLLGILVAINAVFAGSEIAIISLRASRVRRLASESRAGQTLAQLVEEPTRLLSTIQIGITLAGFLASAAAAVRLAGPLEPWLAPFGAAAPAVAVFVVTLAITFVTLVFGELVPKRVALQRAETWSLRAARPLNVIATLATPLVWVLGRSTDAVASLLGVREQPAAEVMTEEEVRDIIATEAAFAPARRALVEGALDLERREVVAIMVPRRDLLMLDAALPAGEGIDALVAAGRSRAPVFFEDPDDIRAVVHLRDLVAGTGDPVRTATIGDAARDAVVLPETASLLTALRRLQSERRQMALVADEHGTIVGIVTVEDVLEEIVGEIYDEFDRELAGGDPRSVVRHRDGSLTVPGSFPVHDLRDVGVDVGEDVGSATVAGLVLEHLERIPEPGEQVDIGRWTFTALAIEGHAVTSVRISARR